MIYKNRTESDVLKTFRALNNRSDLLEDDQKYYSNLEKGFRGEVQFDVLLEKFLCDYYILIDLQFEINRTTFQIDSLMIHQESIYLFEIKNFEGDYCYDIDIFNTTSGKEYKNPLDQLKRSKSLLRQLLQNIGCKFTIEAYVIFVNPEFTLYQAPPALPFIYPTQINRFLKKLQIQPSNLKDYHQSLADKIISLHISKSSYSLFPTYEYQQLKKGITCNVCYSISTSILGKQALCTNCGNKEKVDSAIIRSTQEFKLLFPDQKVTSSKIHEWCKIIESQKKINRTLNKHLTKIGDCKWTRYK
ncbi:nuclease-related domain-containing protein [Litchfieldia salsa]|uniref:Nuclease-related domain-containing protein n=1 Tax=Litchfieldia salsa TaxID=930152 RepID=A0A1H0ULA9_9BACI|nr:nuclease-related domain-containing protein [Litchfieldia salsa]SDP67122.1 Nuclease-related domain-containing protein [Litchfieldia salsa]